MYMVYNKYNNNGTIIDNTKKTKLHNNINSLFKILENSLPTTLIYNNDFTNGSLRIKKEGIYKLSENIIFSPNENKGFFPTNEQFINNDYPPKEFHLGFFAAIVIETNNVIIDLNNHSIEMSPKFKLIQRFFNIIELSHAPFIPSQGPGDFTSILSRKYNICIKNGTLKNSSHNGIHGNNGENILLKNIDIHSVEVSGIQLNGYKNVVIENCNIYNTSNDVHISALFSNAIFARHLSQNIESCKDNWNLLNNDINEVIECINNKLPIPPHCKYLENNVKLPDCNITGIVLSTRGVAINDFKKNRKDADNNNNQNILLKNIKIHDLTSNPIEILGVSKNKTYEQSSSSYTNKVQVGPAGDVISITDLLNDNNDYQGTSLSNLQLELSKLKIGTSNLSNELIEFMENKTKLNDLLILQENEEINEIDKYHLRGNLDIMSHTMKGNMGIFINAGKNIYIDNVSIYNINNIGLKNNNIFKNFIYEDEYRGNITTGITISGSENIETSKLNISNIHSKTGKTYKIRYIK